MKRWPKGMATKARQRDFGLLEVTYRTAHSDHASFESTQTVYCDASQIDRINLLMDELKKEVVLGHKGLGRDF